ncbi:MAG: hypothetical protein LBU57_00010 [Dysgonamonadaceae bacterium]|jgi:hypothetical protein|nr:hypothetical protein [Dysgonamonadaceae bacterium]
MDSYDDLFNFFKGAVNFVKEISGRAEDLYDEHIEKGHQRYDKHLARPTNEELRFYCRDYQNHPERYDIVSKASVKAARKRVRGR